MDTASLIVGAGIALGSAALTLFADVAKGWFERRLRLQDQRGDFMHSTAIELQETLYQLGKATGRKVEVWLDHVKRTGKWERVDTPAEFSSQIQDLKIRAFVLVSRIDNASARETVETYLEAENRIHRANSFDEADIILNDLANGLIATNNRLGEFIRESWSSRR